LFFVSFNLLNVETGIFTKRLNDVFRLNARIPIGDTRTDYALAALLKFYFKIVWFSYINNWFVLENYFSWLDLTYFPTMHELSMIP